MQKQYGNKVKACKPKSNAMKCLGRGKPVTPGGKTSHLITHWKFLVDKIVAIHNVDTVFCLAMIHALKQRPKK